MGAVGVTWTFYGPTGCEIKQKSLEFENLLKPTKHKATGSHSEAPKIEKSNTNTRMGRGLIKGNTHRYVGRAYKLYNVHPVPVACIFTAVYTMHIQQESECVCQRVKAQLVLCPALNFTLQQIALFECRD